MTVISIETRRVSGHLLFKAKNITEHNWRIKAGFAVDYFRQGSNVKNEFLSKLLVFFTCNGARKLTFRHKRKLIFRIFLIPNFLTIVSTEQEK